MNRDQAMTQFLNALRLSSRAKRTIDSYVRCLNRFFDYVEKTIQTSDLNTLTLSDAQQFLLYIDKKKDYAAKTYNIYVYSLRMFYSSVLDRNVDKYKFPIKRKPAQPKPIFTKEEVIILLVNCQDLFLRAAMMLACCSGLRLNEILHLQFGDFNKSKHLILIRNSKGNKSRYVPITESTSQALRAYCYSTGRTHPHPSEYVFPSNKKPGFPMEASVTTRRFQKYIQAFDFYLEGHSFHSLRHVFATHCSMSRVPLPEIATIMGHTSVATTANYIHQPQNAETEIPDFCVNQEVRK